MARKLFEQQILDKATGEIHSVTTVSVEKFYETYVAGRTTDGLEWLEDLTGNEVKTLMFLTEIEDFKSKITHLGPNTRKDLLKRLKLQPKSFTKILKDLEEKKYLIRTSTAELILNPNAFYKGSSKEVLPRIVAFERVYEEIMKRRVDLKAI